MDLGSRTRAFRSCSCSCRPGPRGAAACHGAPCTRSSRRGRPRPPRPRSPSCSSGMSTLRSAPAPAVSARARRECRRTSRRSSCAARGNASRQRREGPCGGGAQRVVASSARRKICASSSVACFMIQAATRPFGRSAHGASSWRHPAPPTRASRRRERTLAFSRALEDLVLGRLLCEPGKGRGRSWGTSGAGPTWPPAGPVALGEPPVDHLEGPGILLLEEPLGEDTGAVLAALLQEDLEQPFAREAILEPRESGERILRMASARAKGTVAPSAFSSVHAISNARASVLSARRPASL